MTVEKAIAITDEIKENTQHEETKLAWINEVEGRIFCELLKNDPSDFKPHISIEEELFLPEVYARIYILYLVSMVSFKNSDYEAYSRAMIEYENSFSEYARYLIRNR